MYHLFCLWLFLLPQFHDWANRYETAAHSSKLIGKTFIAMAHKSLQPKRRKSEMTTNTCYSPFLHTHSRTFNSKGTCVRNGRKWFIKANRIAVQRLTANYENDGEIFLRLKRELGCGKISMALFAEICHENNTFLFLTQYSHRCVSSQMNNCGMWQKTIF